MIKEYALLAAPQKFIEIACKIGYYFSSYLFKSFSKNVNAED